MSGDACVWGERPADRKQSEKVPEMAQMDSETVSYRLPCRAETFLYGRCPGRSGRDPEKAYGRKGYREKSDKEMRRKEKRMGNLFREKSIERISDPEQLDHYIKVTRPGGFLFLAAILLLLLSVWIWAATGTLEITIDTRGWSENGITTCYLTEEEIHQVEVHMKTVSGKNKGVVLMAAELPESYEMMAEKLGSESMVHALGIETGEWRYPVIVSEDTEDGIQSVSIVTDRVSPIHYLLN